MPSLIELQLDVLLARDTQGRLTATRDPTPRPAPRLFLGRSGDGNVWALRQDLDAEASEALRRLYAAEPRLITPRADSSPDCRELVLELLGPVEREYRGPAYVLPERLPTDDRAREVTADERSLWSDTFPWWAAEFDALSPVAIAFAGGQPAAICHSPRGRTAFAAEAGVETLAPFRGQGLAILAVACWARAVQRSGRLALYSTTWDHGASLAIARRLSARLYGENWHLS